MSDNTNALHIADNGLVLVCNQQKELKIYLP
jgi:hypothetical protein